MLALCVVLYEENATPFEDVYAYGCALGYGEKSYVEKVEEFRKIYEKSTWLWLDMHSPKSVFYIQSPDLAEFINLMKDRYRQTGFSGWLSLPIASSYLEEDGKGYYPEYLADGNLSTCWCEGVKGPGIGQWIMIPIPNIIPRSVDFGYQVGIGIVNGNVVSGGARIARFLVEYYEGERSWGDPCEGECRVFHPKVKNNGMVCGFYLRVKNVNGWQYFSFESVAEEYFSRLFEMVKALKRYGDRAHMNMYANSYWVIKLTIDSVYSSPSPSNRSCLSEVRLLYKMKEGYFTFDEKGNLLTVPRSKVERVFSY